ncbi:hypothetical protein [Streptomyces sp. NPDC056549]
MTAIELPVRVRVGDAPDAELARFYRALADEIETMEEVPDAAA